LELVVASCCSECAIQFACPFKCCCGTAPTLCVHVLTDLIMDGTGTSGDDKGLDFFCLLTMADGNQCTIHIDIPVHGNNVLTCGCDGRDLNFGDCSIPGSGHRFFKSGYLVDPNPPPPKSECNGKPCGTPVTNPYCMQTDNGNCYNEATGATVCHGSKFEICS